MHKVSVLCFSKNDFCYSCFTQVDILNKINYNSFNEFRGICLKKKREESAYENYRRYPLCRRE